LHVICCHTFFWFDKAYSFLQWIYTACPKEESVWIQANA